MYFVFHFKVNKVFDLTLLYVILSACLHLVFLPPVIHIHHSGWPVYLNVLVQGLPLQSEESDRGDLMEAKSQLFLKYFTLFMNLLNDCGEAGGAVLAGRKVCLL